MMNDIITPTVSCMSVERYISYMSVKYSLISEIKSAAARYSRKNVMHDAINKQEHITEEQLDPDT